MCLLTISVKNTLPEVVKLAKISQNSGFSRLALVRAREFDQKEGHRDLVIGYRLKRKVLVRKCFFFFIAPRETARTVSLGQ